MGNRKAATAECLKLLNEMIPDGNIVKNMEATLNSLSDQQFDEYLAKLASGEEVISIAVPNLGEDRLKMETMLDLGEKLGHEWYQQIWLTDAKTGTLYLTPERYLILDLPIRRQQQALTEKISIPDHNRAIDEMTGQVTGDSKGASLSLPELQLLRSQGLNRPILEMIKVRGGDLQAFRAINREIIETGQAGLDAVLNTGTRVKSTETLSTLLFGMHIWNNA